MPKPKVSIVFLCYNQEKFVEMALRSALDQDYPDFEVIIADDSSTDGTDQIIQGILSRHPRSSVARTLPKTANLGITRNWNRAIASAAGEVIVTMAGDDVSRIDRLDKLVAAFAAEPAAHAVVSQVTIIGQDGRTLQDRFEASDRPFGLLRRNPSLSGFTFWSGAPVIGASAAYRADIARKFGPIEHATSEDNPSFYRALLMGGISYLPESLVAWRWHGLNASLGAGDDTEEPTAAVVRRAKRARAEYDACGQYRADAARAHQLGLLDEQAYADELVRITRLEALLRVGWHSADPSQSAFTVMASVARHLQAERYHPRAWAYGMRSLVKAVSPIRLKAIINKRSR